MKYASIPANTYTQSSLSIEKAMAYLTSRGVPLVGKPLPVIGRNVILWRPTDEAKPQADLPPLTVSRI